MRDEHETLGKRLLRHLNLRGLGRAVTEVAADDLKRRVRDAIPGDTSAFDEEVDQVVGKLFETSQPEVASTPAESRSGRSSDGAWKPWMTTLGVPLSADASDVRRAHRILVACYHPDNPRTGDRAKFELVRKAFAQAKLDLDFE